ncbi:MAG: aminopeptidase [candidate division Zixibacteria bacterium]|nr:aminopeptidase [candidate division Zixibacteria bacterium]
MPDSRLAKFAYVLLHYSCNVKKNQLVKLIGGVEAIPLLKELVAECLAIGANPYMKITVEDIDEIFLKNAKKDQLTFVSPIAKYEIEKLDTLIGIRSPSNTKFLSGVNPQKQVLAHKSQTKIMRRFSIRAAKGELSWVGTLMPTNAAAQDAGMSLSDYEDFVYGACMLDTKDPIAEWKKMSKYNGRLINYLKKKKVIRLVAPDTDLTFNVGGRKWINCDGNNNFPDGEVFTAPIENSANGHIRFTFPAVYSGREVNDVRIEMKNGKVVKATAAHGEDFMNAMLDMDKGSRYLGEVAIGTNFGIKKFTRNILYDEKIGGTFHMAMGDSYPESGGKNKSALHWDMICDLRKKGAMYADGQLFFKNGKFLK